MEREGTMLLSWLRLLGYTVVIERAGSHWVGLATRPGKAGSDVCIDGAAGSRRELVSTLFSGAVRDLTLQPAQAALATPSGGGAGAVDGSVLAQDFVVRATQVAAFAAASALAVAPGVLAAGSAALTSSATTVASGTSFDLTACVATSGDGGYVIVKGPNTFSQDYHFGPATPCSTFSVGTAGWAAGKYRINGYEFTPKGAKGIGSVTLTVT